MCGRGVAMYHIYLSREREINTLVSHLIWEPERALVFFWCLCQHVTPVKSVGFSFERHFESPRIVNITMYCLLAGWCFLSVEICLDFARLWHRPWKITCPCMKSCKPFHKAFTFPLMWVTRFFWLTGADLYRRLTPYILTEEQLVENGFPRPGTDRGQVSLKIPEGKQLPKPNCEWL